MRPRNPPHFRTLPLQPDHLLIEQNLGAPVLGMRVGHFLAAGVNSIAVLHPSCLAYYELATQAGASSLIKAHEHGLDHTAASLGEGARSKGCRLARKGRQTPRTPPSLSMR